MTALTAPEIILRPVISEKTIDESTRGKYTFAVNVLTTKAKEKRRGTKRGRIVCHTTPWRKAIVTLAPGQKIEFFEGV